MRSRPSAVFGSASRNTSPVHVTAPDAPSQLMQLRQSEALGVLDDHDRGVGNVDTHFDDGGGDEHVDLAAAKLAHHAGLVGPPHPAGEQPDTQLREDLGAQSLVLAGGRSCLRGLGLVYQRTHDVALLAVAHRRSQARRRRRRAAWT